MLVNEITRKDREIILVLKTGGCIEKKKLQKKVRFKLILILCFYYSISNTNINIMTIVLEISFGNCILKDFYCVTLFVFLGGM